MHVASRLCSFLSFLTASVALAQNTIIYDNGAPDLRTGFEITHWIEADTFTLINGGVVKNIKFWDLEFSGNFQNSVTWEIHSQSGSGIPGNLVASGSSMNLTHAATGRLDDFNLPEFVSTFDITPLGLPAGVYWLVLHNGPLSHSDPPNVYWETASNSSTVPSRTNIAPFTGSWQSNGSLSKLAFQVIGIPGPRVVGLKVKNGTAQISFTTVSGQNYRVEYRNSLLSGGWATLPGAAMVPGTGSTVPINDSSIGNLTRRFYRVTLIN
jgi:hypothetical protein